MAWLEGLFCVTEEVKKERARGGILNPQRNKMERAEFLNINELVAFVVVRVNKRYTLKIVQNCAPTASYYCDAVVSSYDDV